MWRLLILTLSLSSLLFSGCRCAPPPGVPDGGPSDAGVSDAPLLDTLASDAPGEAGLDAPDAPEVPSCLADCWRWESPRPDASIRWGLWASATDDAWAVGVSGLAHWDGASWAASGPAVSLRGVWGASASDVWAVGPNGAIHFDGTTWTSDASAPTGLQSVWGAAPNDVWATGVDGVIARWDGTVWTRVSSGTTESLRGVWGLSANDVWALGGGFLGTALLHWDGTRWTPSPFAAGTLPGAMDDAWGASSDDVWATGSGGLYHWNGASWSLSLPFGIGLDAVWGRAADDVWAVGPDGFVLHWNGATWSRVVESTGSALSSLYDVTGVDDAIWAVGYDGVIVRWDGTTFVPDNGWTRADLASVWGASEDDVWAVGGDTLGHFDEAVGTDTILRRRGMDAGYGTRRRAVGGLRCRASLRRGRAGGDPHNATLIRAQSARGASIGVRRAMRCRSSPGSAAPSS